MKKVNPHAPYEYRRRGRQPVNATPGSRAPRVRRHGEYDENGVRIRNQQGWVDWNGKICRTRREALPKRAGGLGPGPYSFMPVIVR